MPARGNRRKKQEMGRREQCSPATDRTVVQRFQQAAGDPLPGQPRQMNGLQIYPQNFARRALLRL